MENTMKRAGQGFLALLVTLTFPLDGLAQPIGVAPVELPRWDIDSGFGILDAGHREEKPFSSDEAAAWHLDVGRYVTPHVKLDAGPMLPGSQTVGRRVGPVDGLPREFDIFEWAVATVRPTIVSAAFTYQFRDNELVHPYLSAGVRMIWQAEHTFRAAQTIRPRGVPILVPGVDERTTSVVARPFIALGCKSYFNSRVFMRPEVLVAFGPSGYSHSTWRIGAGVDF